MPYLNSVVLMGHLTADPELRHLPSGDSVAMFTLGVNSGRSDQKDRKGDFFQCDLWGGWAQNLAKTAKKGSLVLVEGRLTQHRWVDPKTNENRSRIVVLALRGFHLKAQYAEAAHQGASEGLERAVKEHAVQGGFDDEAEEDADTESDEKKPRFSGQTRGTRGLGFQ